MTVLLCKMHVRYVIVKLTEKAKTADMPQMFGGLDKKPYTNSVPSFV